MSGLQDFREQFPQFSEHSDEDLAEAIHQGFYSDMPYAEFSSKIGLVDPSIDTPPTTSQRIDNKIRSTSEQLKGLQDDGTSKLDEFATPEPEERSFFETALRRAGERTTELAGQTLSGLSKIADTSAEAISRALPQPTFATGSGVGGFGGFVFEEDSVLPKYVPAEQFKDIPSAVDVAAKGLKAMDFDSVPVHTWDEVKRHFDEEGLASGMGEVLLYAGETGLASIPDMVGVITSLPVYVTARSNEIGEERARNKGKDKADLTDMMEAAPFALGSALLERFGAKGIAEAGTDLIEQVGKDALKEILKAGGKAGAREAGTEAVQEGLIEYVGEKFGTGAKMDFADAFERGLAGAVAGGPFGGAVGTGTAGGRVLLRDSPEKQLGRALQEEVEGADFAKAAEQVAAEQLSPEQAQYAAGLDVSAPARMERAQKQGFDTATVFSKNTGLC